jgi:hypothetical protein
LALVAIVVGWLGTFLALIAIVVAWWIYRSQQAGARQGILDAVSAELALHRSWVGDGYQPDEWPDPADPAAWWAPDRLRKMTQHSPFVNKLSTVAIDSAIAQGPALFINPRLVVALVQYRQRAAQLNQRIDTATAFAAAPELWTARPSPNLVEHFVQLTADIHWGGIGPADRDGAHRLYLGCGPRAGARTKYQSSRPASVVLFRRHLAST